MLRTTLSRSVRLQTVPLSFRRYNSTRQGDVVDRVEPTPTPAPSTNQEPAPSPRKRPLACDIEKLKAQVQEWTEQAIILLRNRADDFTARSKATFSQLGGQLNKVTGYEEIEALKKGVVAQEERISIARRAAREAKKAHEAAVIQRANSQREVNDLLQRKSLWTDADVGRFTSLVRQDHLYEQEETRAKVAVDETDGAVEKEFSTLMRTILARYHEEQVWSDKIRSASTYGSLAALGLNMLVFIMAILVVEPWKRRRLAQTFEDKVEQLSVANALRLDEAMEKIESKFGKQEELLSVLQGELVRHVEKLEQAHNDSMAVVADPQPSPVAEDVKDVLPEQGPLSLSTRQWELAVVGAGSFAVGLLATVLFSR